MVINNLYTDGIARGWKVIDGAGLEEDLVIAADVAIIGSGAGGALTADILTQAGLNVVIVEAGPLQTSDDFKDMDEGRAYSTLYQEAGGRATSDGAIAILQGRSVGGTTVVNYTTSLRTPELTLNHWAEHHGVTDASNDTLAPWFAQMEKRFNMTPWTIPPNENNDVLSRGCQALGYSHEVIPRNVKGCWNLGYCGMGCPTNAKQSQLVTTLPAALDAGATLLYHAEVERLDMNGDKVVGLSGYTYEADHYTHRPRRFQIKAARYVLAGGAMNNPALLLRSSVPDPHDQVGKRTTLHPVNVTLADMGHAVDGWHGAPQSVYSDEFLFPGGKADGECGFKLEAAPIYPSLTSTIWSRHGRSHHQLNQKTPQMQLMASLIRDGFHEQSVGGQVRIDADTGAPIIDYEITDYVWDGLRRAFDVMAEIQFAAGAKTVFTGHLDAEPQSSLQAFRKELNGLSLESIKTTLFCAHVMGGCAMGGDASHSVCDNDGRYHHLQNLYVFDGSLFPTSLGANPQLSIYGLVGKLATAFAAQQV